MDKQKQIEEMAKVISNARDSYYGTSAGNGYYTPVEYYAKELYNAGYRKIPENAVVLTDKKDIRQYEWSKLVDKMGVIEFGEKVRKETSEKFAERAKDAIINMKWARDDTHIKLVAQGDCLKAIDEIAKEITENGETITGHIPYWATCPQFKNFKKEK